MPKRVTKRERLAALLEAEGFMVSPNDLSPAKGHYRTSPYADCFRWEGSGQGGPERFPNCPQLGVSFASWDTMTACVARGIMVTSDADARERGSRGNVWFFWVSAKESK